MLPTKRPKLSPRSQSCRQHPSPTAMQLTTMGSKWTHGAAKSLKFFVNPHFLEAHLGIFLQKFFWCLFNRHFWYFYAQNLISFLFLNFQSKTEVLSLIQSYSFLKRVKLRPVNFTISAQPSLQSAPREGTKCCLRAGL